MSMQLDDSAARMFLELPRDWREERIHDIADLRTSNVDKKSAEGEAPVKLCNYVDVYYNDKITSEIEFMEATATEAQVERFTLRPDDVVITKDSESPDDIGIPAVVAEEIPALVCGYHLTVIRPDISRVDGSYLRYALESRLSAYQFYLAANGVTRFGLTYQGTKNIRVALPSVREQQQIAAFLDWKTAQIDALIAKKKALIEKLKEKRLALITQAVTKGLDPNVPMRDSNIPWFGNIPSHWNTRRLKFTAGKTLKYGANEPADIADPGLPRYIRITDIQDDGSLSNETFRSLPEDVAAPYLLADGDILLARSGATVGKSFQYLPDWGAAAFAGYLIRYSVDAKVANARYAYLFMRSAVYWAYINSALVQATIQNFSAEKYANIDVPLPPIDEQVAIVNAVDSNLVTLDKQEIATKNAIDRLKEYRAALITAATTGQFDVRNIPVPSAT